MWARIRHWWDALPLRVKLTLLYTGVLALLVAVLSLLVYWDTQRFLVQNTALRIRAQAKPVIERWLYAPEPGASPPVSAPAPPPSPADEQRLRTIARNLAVDLTSRDTVAVIMDARGQVLAVGRRLPEEPEPPPPDEHQVARALAGENEVTYVTTYEETPTLVLLIPLRERPAGSHVLGVVQMSTPLTSVQDILKRQQMTLGLVGGLTVVLGALLGLWLTTATLKPLAIITETCRRIAAGDLSQRVTMSDRNDEVGHLARAFNAMIDRLEHVFQAQRRFIANAAHELRTPLTAIQGSLEVLLRGAQDDPAAVSRLAQGMYREVTRMSRLAEQLLNLSRLETSLEVQRQPVHMNAFFASLANSARLLATEDTFILEEGPDVVLQTDPDMLTQVLFNLIANAVQHNDPGITIRVGWQVDGNTLRIWVEDNGVGISPEDAKHLFEPFYRGDRSRSRRRGGTGLGLALAKAMVEALGGRITVSSHQGARFEIVFPLE